MPGAEPRRQARRLSVALIQLGCPKNVVDGEVMLGIARRAGFEMAAEAEGADVVVVNTCAFIRSAEEEAIDAILGVARLKERGSVRHLVVAGCLAQRHGAALRREIPEIDALIGPARVRAIAELLGRLAAGERGEEALGGFPAVHPEGVRERAGAPHSAYVKIAEGCAHRCAFCLIPRLRGPQCSRPPERIVREVRRLGAEGVREVILVAQDTSAYGREWSAHAGLADLLSRLSKVRGPDWIRVLYTHPGGWNDALVSAFASGWPVLPYVDLPIQHISERVLQAMGRARSSRGIRRLYDTLRKRIPGVVLRTTLMTGHPREGNAEFNELLRFIGEFPFDRLGVFAYSPEAGTRAARLRPRVGRAEAERRRLILMAAQRKISRELLSRRRGTCVQVLVEGVHAERGLLVGRSYAEAPDIDGRIYVKTGAPIREAQLAGGRVPGGSRPRDAGALARGADVGDFLTARIIAAGAHDLVARPAGGAASCAG